VGKVSLHPVQQNENVTQYFIAEKPQLSNALLISLPIKIKK
jgi:hypothetical protein